MTNTAGGRLSGSVSRSEPEVRDRTWVVAFSVLAIFAWLALMWLALPSTFRGDDWDLIHGRSLNDIPSLLRPFNEQWVLVPAVVFRSIFAVFGLSSYLPYLAVLLTFHVVAAAAVARLVRETSGQVPAVVAGAIVLMLGTGNENLAQAFQIGMVIAVAAGLWAIAVAWLNQWHGLAAILMTVALASHLIALPFLAACLSLAVLRPSSRIRSVLWYLLPTAAFAAWVVLFDLPSLAGRGGSTGLSLMAVPGVAIAGPVAAAGAIFDTGVQGGVLVVGGLVALAIVMARRPARPELAIAALVAVVLEYAAVGVSRGSLGLGVILWSRYLYAAVPLVLVAIGAWFGTLPAVTNPWRRRLAVGLLAVGVVAVVANVRAYARDRTLLTDFSSRERAAVAILTRMDGTRPPTFDVHIPSAQDLRMLVRDHGTPLRDGIIPGLVAPPPAELAREVCIELLPPNAVDTCVDVVATSVGRP